MNIEDRKEHVLRFVKLGLDLEACFMLAECSDEEMEQLENDESFVKEVTLCNVIAEKELLDKYEIAMDIAASKGNTNPIQWKLGKINPDRWGDKKNTEDGDIIIPANIVLRGGTNSPSDE